MDPPDASAISVPSAGTSPARLSPVADDWWRRRRGRGSVGFPGNPRGRRNVARRLFQSELCVRPLPDQASAPWPDRHRRGGGGEVVDLLDVEGGGPGRRSTPPPAIPDFLTSTASNGASSTAFAVDRPNHRPAVIVPSPVETAVDGRTPGGGLAHQPRSWLFGPPPPLPHSTTHPHQTSGLGRRPWMDSDERDRMPSLLNVESTPPRVGRRDCFAGDARRFSRDDDDDDDDDAGAAGTGTGTGTVMAAITPPDGHGLEEGDDPPLTSTTVSTEDGHWFGTDPGTTTTASPPSPESPQSRAGGTDEDDGGGGGSVNRPPRRLVVEAAEAGGEEEVFTPRRLFQETAASPRPAPGGGGGGEDENEYGADVVDRAPMPPSAPALERYAGVASHCYDRLAPDICRLVAPTPPTASSSEVGDGDDARDSARDEDRGIGSFAVCSGASGGLGDEGAGEGGGGDDGNNEDREPESPIVYGGVLVRGEITTPSSVMSVSTVPLYESNTGSSHSLDLLLCPSMSPRPERRRLRRREDYRIAAGSGGGEGGRDDERGAVEGAPRKRTRMRHVTTLPSLERGRPIRLRVTEFYSGAFCPYNSSGSARSERRVDAGGVRGEKEEDGWTLGTADYHSHFSFDPFINSGRYTVTTPSGRPWGNGLSVNMGSGGYQTMHDRGGNVLAVTRSRHSFVPSHVIYSPKPRFVNQIPSTHRPPTVFVDGDGPFGAVSTVTSNGGMSSSPSRGLRVPSPPAAGDPGLVRLYPWALVKKEGRRMDSPVSVHMVERGDTVHVAQAGGGINFSKLSSYRSRHGFADGTGGHTHTVITRVERKRRRKGPGGGGRWDGERRRAVGRGDGGDGNDEYDETEVPCCLILRDSSLGNVFNLTIAPGIDPLLVICYLAVHAKMDVEPILSDI